MFTLKRALALGAALSALALVTGCAGVAPQYAASIDNVEVMKKSGMAPAKPGTIAVAPGMPGGDAVQIRAASMRSPVGNHFGDYLAQALRQELELAKLHDATSPVEISGTLLRNNVDAGGISTNAAQVEARFVVRGPEGVRFDKVKRAERSWESAFAGAVAIPLAANNYVLTVQQLIGELVGDADFVKAVRR